MSLMFKLSKGLMYGIFIGLLFGIAFFALGSVAYGMGFVPAALTPTVLGGLIFGDCLLIGVSAEYGKWLKYQNNNDLMFRMVNGFMCGITFGILFSLGIFIISGIAFGMGFMVLTPVQLAGVTFGASMLMFMGVEYTGWLDVKYPDKVPSEAATPPKTGP